MKRVLTEEHKRKIGQAHKGMKRPIGTGAKISLSKIGKKRDEKTIEKMRPTMFRKGCNVGKDNPMWKGGLTQLEKLEKLAGRKRSEQCELCGAFADGYGKRFYGRICFDHDHKTGKFRGWICVRCNTVLGHVKDNSELLLTMVEYLRK